MKPNWREVLSIVVLVIVPIILIILKVPSNQLPFSLGAFIIGMMALLAVQIILIKSRDI